MITNLDLNDQLPKILNKFLINTVCDIDLRGNIPSAELCISREDLFLLSNKNIMNLLEKFINSSSSYILITTNLFSSWNFIEGAYSLNVDTVNSKRMVNLMDVPYNFPLPLYSFPVLINDNRENECIAGVWSKTQIKEALTRSSFGDYYSQMGIDKIIENSFPIYHIGNCIEVGAVDGILYSNTYRLEQGGWNCMCVEPVPYHWPALRNNRRNAINFAISSNNVDNVDFNVAYSQNCPLDGITGLEVDYRTFNLHKTLPGLEDLKIEKIKVNSRRLDWCIENYFPETTIDFISIDVEGTELDVLKSFDIAKYDTKFYVIENNHNDQDVEPYMEQFGYYRCLRMNVNDFYTKEI